MMQARVAYWNGSEGVYGLCGGARGTAWLWLILVAKLMLQPGPSRGSAAAETRLQPAC